MTVQHCKTSGQKTSVAIGSMVSCNEITTTLFFSYSIYFKTLNIIVLIYIYLFLFKNT
jgi:hypothetical protein